MFHRTPHDAHPASRAAANKKCPEVGMPAAKAGPSEGGEKKNLSRWRKTSPGSFEAVEKGEETMSKVLPLIAWALLVASAVAPAEPQAAPPMDSARMDAETYNIFFNPTGAALTPEGREIISDAAKRYAELRGAHIFLIGETRTDKRDVAVQEELLRDGVPGTAIRIVREKATPLPAALREWQQRRVLLAIGTEPPSMLEDRLARSNTKT